MERRDNVTEHGDATSTWSERERFLLESALAEGHTVQACAAQLNRSVETVQAAFQQMQAEHAALFVTRPPAAFAAQTAERRGAAPRGPRFSVRSLSVALTFASAVGVLVFVTWIPNAPTDRIKGGGAPDLVAYAAAGAPLANASPLRAGDTLQLVVRAAAGQAVAVLSLDGRGRITQHFPAVPATHAARLPDEAQRFPLPMALRLDDAPHFERFFLFSSSTSFSLEAAHAALQAVARQADPRRAPAVFDSGAWTDWTVLK